MHLQQLIILERQSSECLDASEIEEKDMKTGSYRGGKPIVLPFLNKSNQQEQLQKKFVNTRKATNNCAENNRNSEEQENNFDSSSLHQQHLNAPLSARTPRLQ